MIDMELDRFLEPGTVTPFLLNVYADAVVVVDRVGGVEEFLQRVRRRIRELVLTRVKDGRAYYWVLPKPVEKVELL